MTLANDDSAPQPESTTTKKTMGKLMTPESLEELLAVNGGRVTDSVIIRSGYSRQSAFTVARKDRQKRFGYRVKNDLGEIWTLHAEGSGKLLVYQKGGMIPPASETRSGRFAITVALIEQPAEGEDFRKRARVTFKPAKGDGAPKEVVFLESKGRKLTTFKQFLSAVGAEIDRLKVKEGFDPLA